MHFMAWQRRANQKQKRSVKFLVMIGFIVAAIGISLLTAVSWHTETKSAQTSELVERGQAVLLTLDRITINLLHAEAAQLRYITHGLAGDLAERENVLGVLDAEMRVVESSAHRDPEHKARIDLLRQLAQQRLPRFTVAPTQNELATRLGMPDAGKSLSNRMHATLTQIALIETARLKALRTEEERWEQYEHTSFALLSGALMVILFFLYSRIHRNISLEEKMKAVLESAREQLESRVQQRTTELERANCLLTSENAERMRTEKALHASQRQLRKLFAHQESIKEQERKRISREMHDGLGQDLYALKIEILALYIRTGTSHPRLHERVARVLQQVDGLMKSVRSVLNNLRPEVLDLGLIAAIRSQVTEFQRCSGIVCKFESPLDHLPMNEECATALFRIVQEALTNIMRHAKATQSSVELLQVGDMLCMNVKDNGCGFSPSARRKNGSFGLLGMRERVNALHGKMELVSEPERGASLAISIPIEPRRQSTGASASK